MNGPIEKIALRIRRGELTLESGRALATSAETTQLLSKESVTGAIDTSQQLRRDGDAELARLILDLLWDALRAWDSPQALGYVIFTGTKLVEATALVLREVADGRMYRRALAIGTAILEAGEGDAKVTAMAARALGILHLDPYAGNHPIAAFPEAYQAWRRSFERLPDRFDADPADLVMPELDEALQRAEEYLRTAVAASTGHMRGLNLKALVHALVWRDRFVQPVPHEEIARLCGEAIALIDESKDPQTMLFVRSVSGDVRDDPAPVSVDELVQRHGPVVAMETIEQLAAAMDHDDAVALLLRARELFEGSGSEPHRVNRWTIMLRKNALPETPELADVQVYRAMTLALEAGSMEAYGVALQCATALRLPSATSDVLTRMNHLVETSEGVYGELTKALIPTAIPIALLGDLAASRMLRTLLKHAIAAVARENGPAVVLALLMQLAKGVTFRSIIATGYDRDALYTPELDGLLREIAESNAPPEPPGVIDEYLLSAWVSDLEIDAGTTPAELLTNLKRRFDRQLYTHLLSLSRMRDAPLILPDALQRALAEDEVFVDFYLGAAPNGNLATLTFLISGDQPFSTQFIVEPFPDANVSLGVENQGLHASPIALIVKDLRESIQLDLPEAIEALERNFERFFGHLAAELPRLHAKGKRVLYVAPHGPLHYVPFHLLGGKTPLADSWTVISVPNSGLAFRHTGSTKDDVAVIGVEFTAATNRFDFSPLPQVATEVERIARTVNVDPILETEATRERVLAELERCRFIHIATHGAMVPNAAAFQTLYLAPSADSDGRLYAHEILRLQLDHVELVTLSACETALGRFDADDNLRGLAANLFLAGVQAIIGTLWEVETNSAAHFFESLYAELQNETPVIAAYRAAQISTRAQFPQYRDWGAFYLMRSPELQ